MALKGHDMFQYQIPLALIFKNKSAHVFLRNGFKKIFAVEFIAVALKHELFE